jgi:hypothetical protein
LSFVSSSRLGSSTGKVSSLKVAPEKATCKIVNEESSHSVIPLQQPPASLLDC